MAYHLYVCMAHTGTDFIIIIRTKQYCNTQYICNFCINFYYYIFLFLVINYFWSSLYLHYYNTHTTTNKQTTKNSTNFKNNIHSPIISKDRRYGKFCYTVFTFYHYCLDIARDKIRQDQFRYPSENIVVLVEDWQSENYFVLIVTFIIKMKEWIWIVILHQLRSAFERSILKSNSGLIVYLCVNLR